LHLCNWSVLLWTVHIVFLLAILSCLSRFSSSSNYILITWQSLDQWLQFLLKQTYNNWCISDYKSIDCHWLSMSIDRSFQTFGAAWLDTRRALCLVHVTTWARAFWYQSVACFGGALCLVHVTTWARAFWYQSVAYIVFVLGSFTFTVTSIE